MAEDFSGAAPAAAEPTPASLPDDGVSNTATAEPTPRGAIDRAFAQMEEGSPEKAPTKSAPETPSEEPEKPKDATTERPRNPDGTFAASDKGEVKPEATAEKPESTPLSAAPARFNDAKAKAEWASVPESVRGEVARGFRELEQGIEKYRGDAEAFEPFRPFAELAQRSNLDAAQTLKGYVDIDMLLARDFNAGIEQIFQRKGVSPREWAAQVMGTTPDQQASQQDRTIAELRREINELRNGVNGAQQGIAQQRQQNIDQAINGFVQALPEADRALFNELDAEIANQLRQPGVTLDQAFTRAKQEAEARYTRLFGPRQQPAPQPPPVAQTDKGRLSVTGAPGPGSDPTNRRPPSSARAAIDNAFAEIGL